MPERWQLIAASRRHARDKSEAGAPDRNLPAKRRPHSLIISCFETSPLTCDVFDSETDSFLHHSEIAALVPPFDSLRSLEPYSLLAKLEYAVDVAGVRHIIVFGNSASHGLECLLNGTEHPALSGWIDVAKLSLKRARNKYGKNCARDMLLRETLRQAVLQSVRNLLTYPCIYKSVKRGQLSLNAWYFEHTDDCLYAYDADAETYRPVQVNDTACARPGRAPQKTSAAVATGTPFCQAVRQAADK